MFWLTAVRDVFSNRIRRVAGGLGWTRPVDLLADLLDRPSITVVV